MSTKNAEDAPGATQGMEVEIDREWIAARRAKSLEELAALDA